MFISIGCQKIKIYLLTSRFKLGRWHLKLVGISYYFFFIKYGYHRVDPNTQFRLFKRIPIKLYYFIFVLNLEVMIEAIVLKRKV